MDTDGSSPRTDFNPSLEASLDPAEWLNAGTPDVLNRTSRVEPLNRGPVSDFVIDDSEGEDGDEDDIIAVTFEIDSPPSEESDLAIILSTFQEHHLSEGLVSTICIRRKKLLESVIKAISRATFCWTHSPLIEHLMIEVQTSLGIFEGKAGQVFLSYDQAALDQHKYFRGGNLIAWSTALGSPCIKALDPSLFQLMSGQEPPLCFRTRPSLSTLAFPCVDGIYLPKQENQFLHYVKKELETYQEQSNRKSVLLFPPLPSRLRYLIHSTTEDIPELATFSVGESWCRRVVVCYSELRAEVEVDGDWESNSSLCAEPLRSREEMDGNARPKSSIPSRSRGPKRPDKPLYMPRAARERLCLQNSQGTTGDQELPSPASSSCSCISSSSDSCLCTETTEKTKSSSKPRQECLPSVAEGVLNHVADSSALIWEQTVSSLADMDLEEDEKDKEDICTDTDDVTEEIKEHLKETVTFSIQHVHNDYSIYENVCTSPNKFPHVIEIYNFPAFYKTDDLLDAFTEYSDGGLKIEWVDNTHALGVFSSEMAALHALSICHPTLKVRSLAQGSKSAIGKAMRRAEFIQPVKERPRTDCAVARRMVTRALGLQGRRRVQRY